MRMVVLVSGFVVAAAGIAAAGPLDKPAFTATPAELLAEARAARPAGHGVAVLRDDVTYAFDERGRVERRYRTVFTVVAPSGADDWGTISLDWQPFYQDKPTIRARVVDADGSVTDFDPSLMHDAPAVNESPTVFSDRRDLTAPLPRLAVGAVVEQEFVFSDREPLLTAGTVHWIGPLRSVPVPRKVITISSPVARKATVVTRGPAIAWKPTTRTAAGRAVVSYDLSNLQPYEDGQPGAPVDWLANPMIGISTGASWAAIAADYRALVEAKLAAPVTVPADLLAATPRATVDRILAWLHGRVRYTGIELSQSAIVPFAPADTLARGFGDCKDKATLLVALLRAAKIPADVALLSTGPGTDVDVALPGMGEFDHAIVRAIVDGKDLWIDATEDLLPAGQLPVRDQGRRALVIAAGTKALTTTPASKPADNLIREVRTFRMPEDGSPRVTEVTEQRGIWSDDLRGFVRNSSKDEVAKSLAAYIEGEYGGGYGVFTSSDPNDLQTPFTLTVEASATDHAGSQRDHLWAWVYPNDAFAKLPDSFVSDEAEDEDRAKARKVDYVWSYPHTYEVVNRFELPPGYSPPALPASETRALGTMTLTTTRAKAPGLYTVTHRVDTGKLRISADELRAGRAAVRALRAEGGQQLVITLDAAQLAQQGKVRDAIAEYRRLIALHPKEALHHGQLASLYLSTGMGEAARREASLATTVEPTSGDAYVVQAYILARDLVGRPGLPGSDRAAAIAALRKALTLSPTHVGAKSELATLLAQGSGRRASSNPADHRAALVLLRELKAAGEDGYDQRIITGMLYAGDAAGLTTFAQSLPDSPARRRALVGAAALTSGEEAVRVATSLASGSAREALLDTLMQDLLPLRRYDALRAVVRARPALSAQQRAVFDRLQPVDLAKLDPADPTTPVRQAVIRMSLGPTTAPAWSAEVEAAMAEEQADPRQLSAFDHMPLPAVTDLLLATTTHTVTGDAKRGWRVTSDTVGTQHAWFVVKRGGRALLVGGPSMAAGIGAEVFAAVGRRDLAGARAWLARVADDPTLPTGPVADFLRRHRDALDAADRPMIELMASLFMGDRFPASAVAVVRACGGFTAADDLRVCATTRATRAATAGDHAEMVAAGRVFVAARPDDALATALLGRALALAGQAPEGGALLDAALAKHPDEEELLEARAVVALASSWTDAAPWFERAAASPRARLQLLNNAAWARLFYDPTPAAARALIDRAMVRDNDPPANVLNTYAAVLVESGEAYRAWQQVERSIGARGVDDADRYVLGRIAEAYDLRDDAIRAYRQVKRPATPGDIPTSWDFAQKRLKAMGVTP